MVVSAPRGEALKVGPHALVVGVEEVRPVLVNENARLLVDVVVAVSADMVPLLDDQYGLAHDGRKALGQHGAGESRADDYDVPLARGDDSGIEDNADTVSVFAILGWGGIFNRRRCCHNVLMG